MYTRLNGTLLPHGVVCSARMRGVQCSFNLHSLFILMEQFYVRVHGNPTDFAGLESRRRPASAVSSGKRQKSDTENGARICLGRSGSSTSSPCRSKVREMVDSATYHQQGPKLQISTAVQTSMCLLNLLPVRPPTMGEDARRFS